MKRSFLANAIISLPRLNAFQAVALGQALIAATKDKDGNALPLPSIVQSALSDLTEDLGLLIKALGNLAEDSPEAQEVDTLMDRLISAFIRALRAWAEVAADLPEGEAAERVLQRIEDEDGLAFVNIKKTEEWAVIETKLQTIAREKLEPDIGAAGLLPLYQAVLSAHARYGEVTGMTKPLAASESAGIREPFDQLRDSIRQYAMAVAGSIERKKPETQVLADQLLKPLAEWPKSKSASKKAAPGTPAAPEGAPTP